MSRDKTTRYDSLFAYYAPPQIDWRLLKAQAVAESNLNPRAESAAGAQGLMQFMPATWREIFHDEDTRPSPFDPEASIQAAAIYMDHLERACDGDLTKALACYNWGIGNVRRHGAHWRDEMPRETKGYIIRIAKEYVKLGGPNLCDES